jgi:hypothetical protein
MRACRQCRQDIQNALFFKEIHAIFKMLNCLDCVGGYQRDSIDSNGFERNLLTNGYRANFVDNFY